MWILQWLLCFQDCEAHFAVVTIFLGLEKGRTIFWDIDVHFEALTSKNFDVYLAVITVSMGKA